MAQQVPTVEIAPGAHMPCLGFGAGGAWVREKGGEEKLRQTFTNALDAGFRHIDEAQAYNNEKIVGPAINAWLEKTKTERSKLWITSKVISADDPGPIAVCNRTLSEAGLTYYDLYLVHTPFKANGKPFTKSLIEIWREMETLVDQGKVRTIGVSNWRVSDLEEIYDQARIKPVCNQVEAHPYLQQRALKKWCEEHKILMTSYRPQASLREKDLMGGPVDAVVEAAAKKYGKTPGQILLRWNFQDGRGVMTTTTNPTGGRIQESLDILSFELTPEEMKAITEAGAGKQKRTLFNTTPLGDGHDVLSKL